MDHYSVLMSVYHKEKPENLAAAIQSMLDQTVVTDDFVIVCDGPLNPPLDAVLEDYVNRYPELFQILRLPENVGVGLATNAGLPLCRHELIAKMDSDDISVPYRCQRQLEQFALDDRLTILGGYIEEFDSATGTPFALRRVPETNAEILRYARRRNPFNNVTVMYKKSAVLNVGGYRPLPRAQDYDIYVRMLMAGFHSGNLPENLVNVRVDSGTHRRRGSLTTLKCCSGIWWYAFRGGFSSLPDLIISLAGGLFLFLCPSSIQQGIYSRFLRETVQSSK